MQTTKEPPEPGTGTEQHAIDVDAIDGPELCDLALFADTYINLKLKALDQARRFYGAGAELRIVNMSRVVNGEAEDGTEGFYAHVYVLCLNLDDHYPLCLDEVF